MTFDLLSKKKLIVLACLLVLYIGLGATFRYLLIGGYVDPLAPPPSLVETDYPLVDGTTVQGRLAAAQQFVDRNLIEQSGHLDLYYVANGTGEGAPDFDKTNSEAVSYYLLWKAREGDKAGFDRVLTFAENSMVHPQFGYLQWRLEPDGSVAGDGVNIASDADLRAIKALMIAEDKWGDARYTAAIDTLAGGLERVAITDDYLLAPYGGPAGADGTWTAREVYLSYTMFDVFAALEERRGDPWDKVYDNMKDRVLGAQIHNGLYNSYLSQHRLYGNGIDGDGYSINSLWIMVRNAESGDPELEASASEALAFYKGKYATDGELYPAYHSSGYAMSPSDTPWVYALVGRAAVALGDDAFADAMVEELLQKQVLTEGDDLFGAFPEGTPETLRVGQFTMQESIITLQQYVEAQPMKAYQGLEG